MRKEYTRSKIMFQKKIAEVGKSNKDIATQYERKWIKLFKEGVHEHNKIHSNKVPEKHENKTGFDYFTQPQIALNVTKKLGFEIKDVEEARKRQKGLMDS